MQRATAHSPAPGHPPRPATAGQQRRAPRSASVAALVALVGLAGCGGDAPRTTAAYCAAVQEHLALIATPAVAAPADITAALDAFEAVTASAPAAVEPEWRDVLEVMRAATTVDRADAAAMSAFVDAALAARPSITRVQQFTQQTCAIDIGTPPTPTTPAMVTVADTVPADGSGG